MADAYVMAAYGGTLIALASSLNYVMFGGITGLSGILSVVLGLKFSQFYFEKFAFVVGMLSTMNFMAEVLGGSYNGVQLLSTKDSLSPVGWILGGLLIGIGTRWSGGCTSGHGVCGLPRFSIKSLIAVLIFMPVGMLVGTFLHSNPIFFSQSPLSASFVKDYIYFSQIILKGLQMVFVTSTAYFTLLGQRYIDRIKIPINFIFGMIFSSGLFFSGMCSRTKILAFLTVSSDWDPSLIIVMLTAVGINLFTFQWIIARGRPFFNQHLLMPDKHLDIGNFIGPVLFGTGWAITGLCPGPAIANLLVNPNCLLLICTIYTGQCLVDFGYDMHEKKVKVN